MDADGRSDGNAGGSSGEAAGSNKNLAEIYTQLAAEMAELAAAGDGWASSKINLEIMHECLKQASQHPNDVPVARCLLQKTVEGLQDGLLETEGATESDVANYRSVYIKVLKVIQDESAYGKPWTNHHVTWYLFNCPDKLRYSVKAVDALVRADLVNVRDYDVGLAHLMNSGINIGAVKMAMHLVKVYLVEENAPEYATEPILYNVYEVLVRLARLEHHPEGLRNLINLLNTKNDKILFMSERPVSGPTAHIHHGILQVQAFDYSDSVFLRKTDVLLCAWINMNNSFITLPSSSTSFGFFVREMSTYGMLPTYDIMSRFFMLSTILCIEAVYVNIANPAVAEHETHRRCYYTVDALVCLIALILKHLSDLTNTHSKINLISKVLGIVTGCVIKDHEKRGLSFHQLPYHRIFVMLLLNLNSPFPEFQQINVQVMIAFCRVFHIIRPAKATGFSFAWLELISHREFLCRVLGPAAHEKGHQMYSQLLVDALEFLAPFITNIPTANPVMAFYQGMLRVLVVILKDFPDFMSNYYYGICDVIPPRCTQMRNVILSAYPTYTRIPDPYTPNLKMHMIQEIVFPPCVLTNFIEIIQPESLKVYLDIYMKDRTPVTFLPELLSHIQVSDESGMTYKVPLMNAIVMYVGTKAIEHVYSRSSTLSEATIAPSAHIDIFQYLSVNLQPEGRYYFFNAMATHLRYPNSHTHYFSCAILHLFAEANSEIIKEQITRVFLERVIVKPPHPWGLCYTFNQLVSNPIYKFWTCGFVNSTPDLKRFFDKMASELNIKRNEDGSQICDVPES